MDTLTHGLLGVAVAALPLPSWLVRPDRSPRAMQAALLASVVAAELPDLDYLLPARDAVLHALKAHRGLTHSLLAAPLIAFVAAAFAKGVFRSAGLDALYARALLAVPLAHLLPDVWTGWGTRLFLPFSEHRLALDWTMVVDPLFTLPLLIASVLAFFRRRSFRRCVAAGVAIAAAYLGVRVAMAHHLTSVVRHRYPEAASVHVFPAPLAVLRFRYVVRFRGAYAAGSVALGADPHEQARVAAYPTGPVPGALTAAPTVREALAWARFPVVRVHAATPAGRRVEVADLRYHLRGKPTLAFVVTVAPDGSVSEAHLDRGGSVEELLRRWRATGP